MTTGQALSQLSYQPILTFMFLFMISLINIHIKQSDVLREGRSLLSLWGQWDQTLLSDSATWTTDFSLSWLVLFLLFHNPLGGHLVFFYHTFSLSWATREGTAFRLTEAQMEVVYGKTFLWWWVLLATAREGPLPPDYLFICLLFLHAYAC